MADDDRAVRERLAALEAEVKASTDAERVRRATALAKLRAQRVTDSAAEPAARSRPARDPAPAIERRRSDFDRRRDIAGGGDPDRSAGGAGGKAPRGIDHLEELSGALELASKAHRVKQELQRTPGKGEKSWIISGVASFAAGPAGWVYAGSLRESVPAATAWIALLALGSKVLPTLLAIPALLVLLPLSAIAGVVYALQFNRTGKRQRLFTGKKPPALTGVSASARRKQLRGGS